MCYYHNNLSPAPPSAPVLVYRTGDYASLAPHGGMLVFKGRKDGQVKVRGHRVHCSEVQRALQALPGVAQCAVLCYQPRQIQQVGIITSTDVLVVLI